MFTWILVLLLAAALIWCSIGEIDYFIKASGIVRPGENVSTISSLMTGRVDLLNISEGDRVQKGDLLFKVDTEDMEQSLAAFEKEKQRIESYKIYEYEKENAEMQKDSKENELEYYEYLLKSTSKNDEKYYEYKLKVAELKKETELAKMDFEYYDEDKENIDKKLFDLSLKSKYYELCLFDEQRKNQQLKVKHLKKRAEIEAVKLESGQSTDNEKQLADMSLKLAENELSAIKKSMESKKRELADFLNQYEDTENFSVKCSLPDKISYQKFDDKKLWKKFFENNFELEKELKGMEFDEDYLEEIKEIYGKDSDTYKSYKNSYEIDTLNFEVKENEYKAKISALISDYEAAWSEYSTCLEYNKILRDKLAILKAAYNSGNISEVGYLEQYTDIKAEMSKVDNALVKTDLLGDKLILVQEGVWSE